MTITDGMGYVAASLVLATFCAKRMVSLRALAISSNVAFITYGSAAHLWPILILHAIMLPLNVMRLRDALALDPPICTGGGATTEINRPQRTDGRHAHCACLDGAILSAGDHSGFADLKAPAKSIS